jgi:hypothetical protein
MSSERWTYALFPAVVVAVLAGCASDNRPDPRETVKGLFAAMKSSDTLYVAKHVDLAQAVTTLGEDLPLDSGVSDAAGALLGQLTGNGKLRERWLENQIVLGRSLTSNDTAWVEVSFIDKLTRVQYYNKMRLEYRGDRWVINSFRTL